MSKKLTHLEYMLKSIEVHGNRYGYVEKYKGMNIKINIRCPIHGIFSQQPSNHIHGINGCPECGNESSSEKQTQSTQYFVEKAREKHKNIYDYTDTKYSGSHNGLYIICPIHGNFYQIATDHLMGAGCPQCAPAKISASKVYDAEKFVRNMVQKYGNEFDYSSVEYIDLHTEIEIICKKHGPFWQKPKHHSHRNGCPQCSKHGFDSTKSAILYYIKDTTNNYYKIGITNRTITERFGTTLMKTIKIIKTWNYDVGRDAKNQEQLYHKQFKEFQKDNENFRNIPGGGFTEFFESDVLGLDI